MTFLQLVQLLEHRLGHHQVPVNVRARTLPELFDSAPLHQDLMQRILSAIYKANRCRSTHDPLSATATFEAIAPIRLEVLQAMNTDVDVYRLLEEICAAVGDAFSAKTDAPAHDRTARERAVVPFVRARRLRSSA